MNFINTRDHSEKLSFKEACIKGLANNGGLYMPEDIPVLPSEFFENISLKSDMELALQVIKPFVEDCLTESELQSVITETISFPMPVVSVDDNNYSLELFHGPTKAFKDIGARFMSRCLSVFASKQSKVNVLVATSGDTGSAVAQGFYNVDKVEVSILFPKGKVSSFQEYQMCSLGDNIRVLEVEGNFDDCQRLVKEAFSDGKLSKQLNLTSANSINIARLLPQMIYYFLAFKQLKEQLVGKKWYISVPSGNYGNLTAGIIAKKMGLPVDKFIAANNINDSFHQFMQQGVFMNKTSKPTYSSAMDVGSPSNFERLKHLYPDGYLSMRTDILSASFSDKETLEQMEETYKNHDYILDPHGAVGQLALNQFIDENTVGVFLQTASPEKFDGIVKKVIPDFPSVQLVDKVYAKECISNDYQSFRKCLVKTLV